MTHKSLNIKTLYIQNLKKNKKTKHLQNNTLKMSKEAFTGSHILAIRMLISKHA